MKRTISLAGVVAMGLLSGTAPGQAETGPPLRLGDLRGWTVVVGEDAIPSERFAGAEFCRLFKAATGSELPVSTSVGRPGVVYIGASAALRAHPLGFGVTELGDEGLRIRIADKAVLIAGGRPRGTLYGVYEFFERYVGVRFLTADDTYVPPDAVQAVLSPVDYRHVPAFSFRWSFYKENFKDPAFATRLRVNTITTEERLGGKTAQGLITHSMATYLPVAVYGRTHPEYFALVDGRRSLDAGGGGPQVCSTNPAVIKIVTAAVERALNADPTLQSISLSQMDNDEYCRCPECSALSAKEGSLAAPHLALVNAVAEKIAQTHPRVKIGTLVYWYTRKPPRTIRLQPNVEIMLCSIECCTLHPLDDPDCRRNRVFAEDYDQWKKICRHILIWNYNTNFAAYDLPFPNFNAIAKNVQFFRDHGAEGVFMQAAGDGLSAELSDLRNYVMANCLWDPTHESWALVEEFCRLHYGAAAPPILACLRFLHHNAEVRGVHPNCFPVPVEVGLDASVARRLYAFWQEAWRLAPDDIIRQRVEKGMIPALRALLDTTPRVLEGGLYRLSPSVRTDVLDRYVMLTRKFGVDRAADDMTMEDRIKQLQLLRDGVPGIVLENKAWWILFLPEQKGRIAELVYKPTGRSLVPMPKAGAFRPGEEKVTWHLRDGALTVIWTLSDGGVWRRAVSLPADAAGMIRFEAEFTAGAPRLDWKRSESPAPYAISNSGSSQDVSVYTNSGSWTLANGDWDFDREIGFHHSLAVKPGCTGYACYDHPGHFGLQQTFEPGTFQHFRLFWHPGRGEVTLEMLTPGVSLQTGQSISWRYELSYLAQPPL